MFKPRFCQKHAGRAPTSTDDMTVLSFADCELAEFEYQFVDVDWDEFLELKKAKSTLTFALPCPQFGLVMI